MTTVLVFHETTTNTIETTALINAWKVQKKTNCDTVANHSIIRMRHGKTELTR